MLVLPSNVPPIREPGDTRPEIPWGGGAVVYIVRAEDRLGASDHVVRGGACSIIRLSAIGQTKGAAYLTDVVVRPMTGDAIINLAHRLLAARRS
jgi:hypothetical protein